MTKPGTANGTGLFDLVLTGLAMLSTDSLLASLLLDDDDATRRSACALNQHNFLVGQNTVHQNKR
ncbi:hypothetical protein D3C72_2258880 [compost metagenome]